MPDLTEKHAAICLNMIVRNEAHVVCEALDSLASYITSWVIVDTGSDDGTQDVIRDHMASLGIPGELHERPWRDFGSNRTEALNLAQGHGDYIWVMDADDILVGTPELGNLEAGCYSVRYQMGGDVTWWRRQLFRDGLPWRYEGVVHETPACDASFTDARLEGDYYIDYRQVGYRSLAGEKYARDAEVLLAELERNPNDLRSMAFLAQCYFNAGDHSNARKWNERRIELGDKSYLVLQQIAMSMQHVGEPWPDVQDAYLRAWEFQPSRAEPLYSIAESYRIAGRFQLGYLFAKRAAQIPLPEGDDVFVWSDVYAWRAVDEQAVCASQLGRHAEAFAFCRYVVAWPDVPDDERQRVAGNRDYSVPSMLDVASVYPGELVGGLVAGLREAEVTVAMVAGSDRDVVELTLNSFVNCCADVSRVGRFVVVDAGLSAVDRAVLAQRYGFVDFIDADAGGEGDDQLARLCAEAGGRYLLYLGSGWRFFAPEAYITRLTAVLAAEQDVYQVGVNFTDAVKPNGACASEEVVRRTADAGRYVLAGTVTLGPAMYDTERFDNREGLGTATLDEVLCLLGGAP